MAFDTTHHQFYIQVCPHCYCLITQTHLSIRKNKLDSILASKRKISLNYIGDNLNNYKIKIEELNIPQQFQINIYQFFENVRFNL